MIAEQWTLFDKAREETFPPDGAYVLVETESGNRFNARFSREGESFSLYYSLWGTQGQVTRWRLQQNPETTAPAP